MNRYLIVSGLSIVIFLGIFFLIIGSPETKPETKAFILMLLALGFSTLAAAAAISGTYMLTRQKSQLLNVCYGLELVFGLGFLSCVLNGFTRSPEVYQFFSLLSAMLGLAIIAAGNLVSWSVEYSRRKGLRQANN